MDEHDTFVKDDSVELARISEEILMFKLIIEKEQEIIDRVSLPADASVLDLLCGPGDWGLEVALRHPDMEVVGVDVSSIYVDYARVRAKSQNIHNISFGEVDLNQPLDFSSDTFDLVYCRSLGLFIKRDQWSDALQEMLRILRPGGAFCLIGIEQVQTNSDILEKLSAYVLKEFWRDGYGLSPEGRSLGVLPVAVPYFKRAGFVDVHQDIYTVNFSVNEPFYTIVTHNLDLMLKNIFFVSINISFTKKEIEEFYRQARIDVLSDTFCGLMYMYAVYGRKPV